jgi:hypothetical protein
LFKKAKSEAGKEGKGIRTTREKRKRKRSTRHVTGATDAEFPVSTLRAQQSI